MKRKVIALTIVFVLLVGMVLLLACSSPKSDGYIDIYSWKSSDFTIDEKGDYVWGSDNTTGVTKYYKSFATSDNTTSE